MDSTDFDENLEISYEEARRIIDKQTEAYYNIQEQAQKAIRLFLSLFTVVLAAISVLSSGLLEVTWPPSAFGSNLSAAGQEAIRFSDPAVVVITSHVLLGLSLTIIGILTFAAYPLQAVAILHSPRLEPGINIRKSYDIHIVEGGEHYPKWISENHEFLRYVGNKLESMYEQIIFSVFILIFGVGILLLTYSTNPTIIVFFDFFLLYIVIAAVISGINQIRKELVSLRDTMTISRIMEAIRFVLPRDSLTLSIIGVGSVSTFSIYLISGFDVIFTAILFGILTFIMSKYLG